MNNQLGYLADCFAIGRRFESLVVGKRQNIRLEICEYLLDDSS